MRLTLALIFFLSGASALVFESLWFRLVGLSLGNSVWSASLVLAAFMGGLALGNALVAKLHGRIARPLRVYAGLEFAMKGGADTFINKGTNGRWEGVLDTDDLALYHQAMGFEFPAAGATASCAVLSLAERTRRAVARETARTSTRWTD